MRRIDRRTHTRNGFTPAARAQLFKKFRGLQIHECPFVNLPEAKSGRWGQGLTKAKMAECQWLKPVLVGPFEFLEWTGENHLRHSKFIGLREDKPAKKRFPGMSAQAGSKSSPHRASDQRFSHEDRPPGRRTKG